ncbi:MAG: Flp pilus assembly complex ATPase component TadA, partial [Thermoleophilia bacterium]|nr:Flp pilus assembly complex ATPase component TadA [Thermoleophilia bacterium]
MAEILKEVVRRNASDLHLAVGVPPVVRVDGRLQPLDYPPLSPDTARQLVYSILTQDQRQKLETDWEVDLSYSLYGQARFRVNAFFQRGTLGAAFRLVPFAIRSIEELGLPPVLHTFAQKPRGLVLVTGPTGSGKSTTLAA